ncbi:MAG TPA: hypothetical protein PKX06_10795 [Phenylobacterium sp.]|nr:hypothetical protein [Phenylobacterium sp.]
MSEAPDLRPDEVALRRDLASLSFKIAVSRGKWEVALLEFPFLYVRIAAGARPTGPRHFLLRLDCTGYRAIAPTAQLWDAKENLALPEAQRPRAPDGSLVVAFSSSCGPCLYHPIDRMARAHWPNAHGDLAWGGNSTILTFLETVHGLVHDTGYSSSTAPDAAAELQGGPLARDPARAA